MTALRLAIAELIGMFVDDGMLAVFTVLLIGIVTALVEIAKLPGLLGGAILFAGSIAILAESVVRAARKR
ncbi:hypothetical protein HDIA_2171 [Hartmannibacter diazotrophicus]|uniref:Uncharacterized protein n=1 Tax=Hartmannibacter diazotrophicus TaxID=1482074 RepID=A0A2C9D5V4_9HYPH|nr:hypothetical protein [Hartmannibacter diazotrophicus]SON55712.1 hypothetical protein HDIA_2171 [Hartmannibacter diazotrophicus]